jgi:hypothetical protein
LFPVFEDENHGGLRLNLLLQIKKLGLLLERVLLVIWAVAKGGQAEGSDGGQPVASARSDAGLSGFSRH